MAIKNYRTRVGFYRTISEIEKILSEHGVTQVSKVLEDGDPVAIYFTIPYNNIPVNYKLQTNWEKVYKILQDTSGAKKTEKHAKRVAWRNIKDWIDAQTALIETEMVELQQIFLPYMVDQNDQTVYDRFLEQGPKLLTGDKS